MRIPSSTYRVQFNADFRFEHALAIVPQLHSLGITHLYASPVFAARPGSTHGYDVTDPNRLNPELGTPEEFDQLVTALKEHGMGLVLDIVPNHMAASADNRWWMDVLENGPASPYAGYFGVRWSAAREEVEEKIFLPILGAPYGKALEAGELKLSFEDGAFFLRYYEHKLPIAPVTWVQIVKPACEPLTDNPDVLLLLESLERMPPRSSTDWEALEHRRREKDSLKQRIAQLAETVPGFREGIETSIATLNGTVGVPSSFDALHEILENQAWRLAWWRVARDRINYRRFFDVSELIGMKVEREEVFRASHELVLRLIDEGKVDGLRIDHIDGLNDPLGYLERLPSDVYTVAEKILVGTERLPEDWPIQGTSGYDFLGYANALYVSAEGLERIDAFYRDAIGFTESLEDVEYDRKRLAMRTLFPGEVADLGASLALLAEADRVARDLSPRDMTRALREITACLPVYRTYTRNYSVTEADRRRIEEAKRDALERSAGMIATDAFDFVARVLMLKFLPNMSSEQKYAWLRFVRRWQQLSGPVMAKGVEDSAYYFYNRLVSLNEVGGIPRPVGIQEMHEFLSSRAQRWPGAMNGSSTHDTKRSEDVRSRIHVLSELTDEWTRIVMKWRRMMAKRRGAVDDNEEYFIYQNLIGAWPLNDEEVPAFRDRFKNYLTKAAREARANSNWLQPNVEHEAALHAFADLLFDDHAFQTSFQGFLSKLAFHGAMNSLSQTLLKIAAPGIPDFYRGTITWDFSLVDPDNRRPVDFAPLTNFEHTPTKLLASWKDGRIKVFLTETGLGFRVANAALFERGEYIPLEVRGTRAEHVFAFARRLDGQWAVCIVPRLMARLAPAGRAPLGEKAWADTEIVLPEGFPAEWKNNITDENLESSDGRLLVSRIFGAFPAALLSSRSTI